MSAAAELLSRDCGTDTTVQNSIDTSVAKLLEEIEEGIGIEGLDCVYLRSALQSFGAAIQRKARHSKTCPLGGGSLLPFAKPLAVSEEWGVHSAAASLTPEALAQLANALMQCFARTLQLLDEENMDEPDLILENVKHLSLTAASLGLQDLSCEAAMATTLAHVQRHIAQQAEQDLSSPWLEQALQYTSASPLLLLQQALPETGASGWKLAAQRLQYFVYERAGLALIGQLFDLIVDFPDSIPSLQDLHTCLQLTNLHAFLASEFCAATQKRLLHPGAATSDIVQQYISSIRAMRHVDPLGTALAPARTAIQNYLRTRRDAIRCIVGLLTADGDDESNLVLEELEGDLGEPAAGSTSRPCFDGLDADKQALLQARKWRPESVESGGEAAGSDAVSQLVEIWGSKDLFVTEYRTMLAERLLGKQDYDCDRELHTLELLKLRFGDAALITPEIMLKDMVDSKRNNANIQSALQASGAPSSTRITAIMLSALYWPQASGTAQEAALRLPEDVAALLAEYSGAYRSLKAPRKLQWRPSQGLVELEVALEGGLLECMASPAQASALLCFRASPELTLEQLAVQLGLPPEIAKKQVEFWVRKGVLREVSGPDQPSVYGRNRRLKAADPGTGAHMVMDEDGEEAEGPQLDAGLQVMTSYEPFILGMLANFDALPLDRIHNMLKMFVADPPYDKSLDQLSTYLKHLVAQDKLMAEGGGLYKQKTSG